MTLIDIGCCEDAIKTGICENLATYSVKGGTTSDRFIIEIVFTPSPSPLVKVTKHGNQARVNHPHISVSPGSVLPFVSAILDHWLQTCLTFDPRLFIPDF